MINKAITFLSSRLISCKFEPLKRLLNVGHVIDESGIERKSMAESMSGLNCDTNRLVWIDMEMTGLDVEKDLIMEVACLITDGQLNIVAEGPDLIINQPQSVLDTMNDWCIKQHGKSGLTEACQNSQLSVQEAEDILLNFISKHVVENSSPLAGSSVYMDRIFLRKYMPRVNNYLHYRIVDVSTVKELCRIWNCSIQKNVPKKSFAHRALNDIRESIDELKYYKNNFFKP